MSRLNIEIGKIIRKRRKSLDYTQEQLAELSDLNVTFIGEIERGHCNPTIDTLNKIASALNFTLSQLIRDAEGGEKPQGQIETLLMEYTEKIIAACEEETGMKKAEQ